MQGPRTRPRKPVRKGEVLFAVGGWCSGDAIATVERYDPQANEWRMVSPMSKRRCGVGVAVLNDLLYAVGGHDGQSYLNSIERFDPQTSQWSSDVAPTSSCRTSVGVAVLDGYVIFPLTKPFTLMRYVKRNYHCWKMKDHGFFLSQIPLRGRRTRRYLLFEYCGEVRNAEKSMGECHPDEHKKTRCRCGRAGRILVRDGRLRRHFATEHSGALRSQK